MEKTTIPQAASPLATWLSYLEHLGSSKTIDLGLARVSEVAKRMAVLKPAPFVFTVAGTNGKGDYLPYPGVGADGGGLQGWSLQFAASGTLHRAGARAGRGADGAGAHYLFAEIEAARGEISLSYFEFGTLPRCGCFSRRGWMGDS